MVSSFLANSTLDIFSYHVVPLCPRCRRGISDLHLISDGISFDRMRFYAFHVIRNAFKSQLENKQNTQIWKNTQTIIIIDKLSTRQHFKTWIIEVFVALKFSINHNFYL